MKNNSLKEITFLFLKLGIIGFGGPAAHISMMRQEVVTKKKWLSEQQFLDLLGITNLIPGPNSTEMAAHIGYEKHGLKGMLAAGISFILPAVLITGVIAVLYKKYGQLPEVYPYIYGIKPAIIAVIAAAVYPLARRTIKSIFLGFLGLVVLAASLLNFNEAVLLFGSGIAAVTVGIFKSNNRNNTRAVFLPLLSLSASPNEALPYMKLFLIFIKLGSILYGSGYLLFAFLDTELVAKGFLSRRELIDAIAVGQFTPGPVFSSVTFIGYQMQGCAGAVIATFAIFIPGFLFIALLNPVLKKLKRSKLFTVFLDAVNTASVAIILSVCFKMGKEVIIDWRSIIILITTVTLTLILKKMNSALIVIFGCVAGYILQVIN